MLYTQNTLLNNFGAETDAKANVQMVYDSSVSGFRAAKTTDFANTTYVSVESGQAANISVTNLFDGRVSGQVGVSGGFVGITGNISLSPSTNISVTGTVTTNSTVSNQLSVSGGNISTYDNQYSTISNFSVTGGSGNIFNLGVKEAGFVQNLGTNPLFLCKGTGCGPDRFSMILKAGVSLNDGVGGTVSINDYIGIVSASGTSPSYIAYKLS